VIERSTGLLRVFDKDLEQSARQNAVDDIRRSARTAGILQDAVERAQAQVKSLCRQMGFEEVEILGR
jgi:adenine/guanine phosphoribosyltransferase-like PRPP-binding protein